jgi:hypothetical protein
MSPLIGTFKNKNRPPFILVWLGWVISSLLGIVDGICNILTLCFWFPNFQFRFIFWNSKKQLTFNIKKNKSSKIMS